jgi:hypothetical protein
MLGNKPEKALATENAESSEGFRGIVVLRINFSHQAQ